MPAWVEFVLYLVAFIFFGMAAAGVATRRVNLLGLGLACWVFVPLVHALDRMT